MKRAFLVSGFYGLLGPPLGALMVVGPLFAVFGYIAIGHAALVGLIHGVLLAWVRTPWLRLVVMPPIGLAATTQFFFSTTTPHAGAWLADLLNQDFGLIARAALPPTIICMGLVEAIHQSRWRVRNVRLEPLRLSHLDELDEVLRQPAVYEHIGAVPSAADFKLDLQRAIEGPPEERADEVWLNWLVRDEVGICTLGRMEAVAHHGLVEVAFLLSPDFWGRGLARQALARMHIELEKRFEQRDFWATTAATNQRCRALLERSGYVQVTAPTPKLLSYDDGDLVYVRTGSGKQPAR